ncbi:hypothetical protein MYX75_11890, partial [Acidobacteria bacterium AH-259-A15]|nr:hypothetical protein [Acidobacteria bacterium AH-259-A15]
FLTSGFGAVRFNPTKEAKALALSDQFIGQPTQIGSTIKLSVTLGGGFEARFNRWLGVRLEAKDNMSAIPRFGLGETSSGPGGTFFPVDGIVHNIDAAAGVVFYFSR